MTIYFKHKQLLLITTIILSFVQLISHGSDEPSSKINVPLKVISYNVLYGFNHKKNETEGADWLRKQAPDVLGLQELNRFTEKKLKKLALKWNHKYATILKERGFPVGLTSRTPIKIIEKRIKGFKHGYLHCKTAGIHFFVVHLNPHGYKNRQKEAKIIAKKVSNLISTGRHVIVLGDFNSYSESDSKKMLNRPELKNRMKKYKNLNDGEFDYTVMDTFTSINLVDVCIKRISTKGLTRFSFPTKLVKHAKTIEDQAKYSARIDFILLSKQLAKKVTYAKIPRDKALESISDHFPVVIKLK